MSDPSFQSEHTSPVSSVRSSVAPAKSNHVSGTTSPSKPKTITSVTSAQPDDTGATQNVIKYDPQDIEQLPNSANHHGKTRNEVGSDPNTPRLAPSRNGSGDLQNILHEEIVPLDRSHQKIPDVLSSSIESSKHRFLASRPSVSSFSSSVSEPGSGDLDLYQDQPQHPSPSRTFKAYRDTRVATWLEESRRLDTASFAKPVTIPHSLRTQSHRLPTKMSTPETSEQEEKQNASSMAREEAFSEKRNRSSSRNSQRRVEKRIEATLADAEPSSHARSRKSSHTLGLFKETAASQGLQGRQSSARTASDNAIDPSATAGPYLDHDKAKQGERGQLTSYQRHGDNEAKEEVLLKVKEQQYHVPEDKKPSHEARRPSDSIPPQKSSEDYVPTAGSDPGITDEASLKNKTTQSLKTGDVPKRYVPPGLLEDIKDYHNLPTALHEKIRSQRLHHTTPQQVKEESEAETYSKGITATGHEVHKDLSEGKATDEENEDEESEHISSILYNPHQAPSPDTLVDVSIDDARKLKEASVDSETHLPEPALPPVEETEDTEDVDIALQIHNKNRYFHGDLSKAKQPSIESDAKQATESSLSSASESEYESQDENRPFGSQEDSSLTDDAEATPRASPNSRKSYLASRSRKSRRGPVAPLVAVELKPYNHQVGGHTKVFRFSKRAVCKQLSNRENVFYEVVERLHPELLSFLPKYVLSSIPSSSVLHNLCRSFTADVVVRLATLVYIDISLGT